MTDLRSPGTLSELAKATLNSILQRGEATRKVIATDVGISFPTVTNVIGELEALSLVREVRREQGARGRATLVYGVSEKAGWVLAVDVGSTQVRYVARGLDGSTRASRVERVERLDGFEPARRAASMTAELLQQVHDAGPLLSVAIGINQVVPKSFVAREPTSDPRLTHDIVAVFMGGAGIPHEVPVLVENNVNCAAVAEHEDGMMQGLDDCAYMQIGVGIGLGYFSDGVLIRGGSGASGELAQIPVSWSADVASPRDLIEHTYGSGGLLAAARAAWPGADLPESTEEVFARAEEGNDVARSIMRTHAVALARIAATAATIIDPSVLVLGGGLSRSLRFVELIADEFASRTARTQLRASSKGTAATVEGAVILARDLALSRMLGSRHRALLGRPAIWGEWARDADGPGTSDTTTETERAAAAGGGDG